MLGHSHQRTTLARGLASRLGIAPPFDSRRRVRRHSAPPAFHSLRSLKCGRRESNPHLMRGNERRVKEPFIGTEVFCAGYENRTRIYCLGSSRSTTKLIPHKKTLTVIRSLNYARGVKNLADFYHESEEHVYFRSVSQTVLFSPRGLSPSVDSAGAVAPDSDSESTHVTSGAYHHLNKFSNF